MDRPLQTEQAMAAQVLADKLNDLNYLSAGELGMVDLTPQALGVLSDPVRVLLHKLEPGTPGPDLHSMASRESGM